MFSIRDLYPNAGAISTYEQTIPERPEQASLGQVDRVTDMPVDQAQAFNIWMGLAVLFVIFWLMHWL